MVLHEVWHIYCFNIFCKTIKTNKKKQVSFEKIMNTGLYTLFLYFKIINTFFLC